jgi:hypothetical protein
MNDATARVRSATPSRAELVDVVRALIDERNAELITVVCGAGVDQGERDAARGELAAAFPGRSVEVYDGGQPAPFVVAVE